jgi:hypothetical protein
MSDFINTPMKPNRATAKVEKVDKNKQLLDEVVAIHRANIAESKRDIKRSKLLIKQARIMYKLSKIEETK